MILFMKNSIRFFNPLLLCILLLLIVTGIIYLKILADNNYNFVYTLDDAYIHMAMAKNFAAFGVWGITPFEFTSSSSSIIWTLMLSGFYFALGPNQYLPIILNLVFALLVLDASYRILKNRRLKSGAILLILFLVIFVSPLPPLMFTGLEHVMHIWFSVLYIYFVSEELSSALKRNDFIMLTVISALMPLSRYESLFLIFVTFLLFLVSGKYFKGVVLLFSSIIPVIIFGFISVEKGWSFFPNSMLLKAGMPDIASLPDLLKFVSFIYAAFVPKGLHIFLLVICIALAISTICIRERIKNWLCNRDLTLMILLISNIVLYSLYSRSGWTYRYQSFLIALGILIISLVYYQYVYTNFKQKIIVNSVISLMVILPLLYFFMSSFRLITAIPQASSNIYEQQVQMGRFVNMFYNSRKVALNDIGAVNYFSDIHCVDLWGLGNLDASKMRRSGIFGEKEIFELTTNDKADIAIIYDSWFMEEGCSVLPRGWKKAGEWKISNNIVASDDRVSFYAVKPQEEPVLIENLRHFSRLLPAGVVQSGKYLDN